MIINFIIKTIKVISIIIIYISKIVFIYMRDKSSGKKSIFKYAIIMY